MCISSVYDSVYHYWFSLAVCFFFFKQKTAYEMRISDWSSDVCSSDLSAQRRVLGAQCQLAALSALAHSDGGPLRRDAELKALAVGRAEIGSPSRSEERRVGKECVSTCRSRWPPYP